MSFSIGSQNAHLINNVEGNQTIHGGQSVVVALPEARAAAEQLRAAVHALPLPAVTRTAAAGDVAAAAAELTKEEPDRRSVATYLGRLVDVLRPAGVLVAQTAALVGPFQVLLGWLGSHAGALVGVLGSLA